MLHSNLPRLLGDARRTPVSAAVLAAFVLVAPVRAFEIPTGNDDLVVRWDNTVRYNLGMRTQLQDKAIIANPNYDDGDRNFTRNQLTANRLDVLSELDLVYDKRFGARVSAAGWVDGAYNSLSNHNNASANTMVNGVPTAGVLSPYTNRYANGPSGEFLDAFVFANFDIVGMPLNVRLGSHTVYWGESLLGAGAIHGISYGQYSLDLWKGFATPGVEAKELYRPRDAVTMQFQPTTELTLAAQAFFGWESVRYPESGSYLTVQDALLHGGDSLISGPNQRLLQGTSGTPSKTGDWGLSSRWSPEWLNGTAGLYLRRTADIQPQLAVSPAVAALPPAPCTGLGFRPLPGNNCYINPAAATVPQILAGQVGQYSTTYGRNIDILGFSLSQNLSGISVGTELSYRRNMPLASALVTALPTALVNAAKGQVALATLADGDAVGARGNTMHGVLNFVGSIPKTAFFDAASWSSELVWNRWLSVSQNAAAFKGSDAYRNTAGNVDGVTKDYLGLAINFTPTWFQALPSVDLSVPFAWGGGLIGNSAVQSGGNANAGSFSLGVAADIQSKYYLALRYIGYYGSYSTTAAGAMNVPNGVNSALSDRGSVVLTAKATF